MDTIILVSVLGAMNIICFYVGAKIGQTVSKGEHITIPNPVKGIEQLIDSVESREEKEIFEINMANIESYDGTGLGQREFK